MKRPLTLLVLLAASVVACGRNAPPSTTAPQVLGDSGAARAQALAPAAPAADSNAAREAAVDAANDDPVGTSSLERVADLPAQQQLPAGKWRAGADYEPVVPAQPTSVTAGKVEVMEVFWYACPHCYALEPFLVDWKKKKPAYVEFVRVPVMWGPVHRAHAQLYYTLKELGRNDLDQKVFDTLHQGQNPLVGNTPDETLQRQLEWATANGISADAFKKAWSSFAVTNDLQHAQDITQRYQVEGVPFIAINGKFATGVDKTGSHEKLIELINDLTASEHHH